MKFSEKFGYTSPKTAIQIEGIDQDLKNGLWNALHIFFWDHLSDGHFSYNEELSTLMQIVWVRYFKKTLDNFSYYWDDTGAFIKKYYYACEWYEAYDFIEFCADHYPNEHTADDFRSFCNKVLETEKSGYRFVSKEIAPITSLDEISAIQDAQEATESLLGANSHLKHALKLLSDRKNSDYRNSIKESISAVEAICRTVSGNTKATLGDALKELEKNHALHGALKSAFSNLYGYTSDTGGIRHALLEESKIDFDDAKFMLVSCSAFVNYILSKSALKS